MLGLNLGLGLSLTERVCVCCVAEPILPRRHKHPLLAYRCHDVLGLTAAASEDCLDSARSDRFRVSSRQQTADRSTRHKRQALPKISYF